MQCVCVCVCVCVCLCVGLTGVVLMCEVVARCTAVETRVKLKVKLKVKPACSLFVLCGFNTRSQPQHVSQVCV